MGFFWTIVALIVTLGLAWRYIGSYMAAVFDGRVTGKLDDPHVDGQLSVTRFSYEGKSFDSLAGGVTASSGNIQLADASLGPHRCPPN